MNPGAPQARATPDVPPRRDRALLRAILIRVGFLLVSLVALYVLWPSLLSVLSTFPELLRIRPEWFVVLLALESASFVCMWGLQRLALRSGTWFVVATSQLSGNALSRIVPGGAAVGAALQYRMLAQAGIATTTAGTALTATSLIGTATLLALPVLAIPAILAGRPVPAGLAQSAWMGAGVFVLLVGAGAILISTDRPLELLALVLQRVRNMMRRRSQARTDLPERLLRERDEIRTLLGAAWWRAVVLAAGNSLLDFLALLAALAAVGSGPRPSLVLLAYVAAAVLTMIPLTPGGLGFVEAGLTALLVVAGVEAASASIAVLAYRLVSFWLPMPAGAAAALLYRRRYGAPRPVTG